MELARNNKFVSATKNKKTALNNTEKPNKIVIKID